MRLLLRLLYPVRRVILKWLRICTRGVKVIVLNARGELLLVRNSYGSTHLFVLPGGGIGRAEAPAGAAAREVLEETALAVEGLEPLAIYASDAEGKRDTIHLFKAAATGEPRADRIEVEEAAFFPLHALPPNVSASTRRRIAELESGRFTGGAW